MGDDKEDNASSDSFSPLRGPRGLTLSEFEKAEDLTHSLEDQFQSVNDPSELAVAEMVNETRGYKYAPLSDPKLTGPTGQQETKGSQGIPNRVLRHL
jgi:hypothetical protein